MSDIPIYNGEYPLSELKYFRPEIAFSVECPRCGGSLTVDASDNILEYPEPTGNKVELECDCGARITMTLSVALTCEIGVTGVEEIT